MKEEFKTFVIMERFVEHFAIFQRKVDQNLLVSEQKL